MLMINPIKHRIVSNNIINPGNMVPPAERLPYPGFTQFIALRSYSHRTKVHHIKTAIGIESNHFKNTVFLFLSIMARR